MESIKIDGIEKSQSSQGKDFLKVKSSKYTYQCWDSQYFPALVEGTTVNVEIDKSGKFWKITEVESQQSQESQPSQQQEGQQPKVQAPTGQQKNDLAILYQTCLNRIVDLYVAKMGKENNPALPDPNSIMTHTGTLFEAAINNIKRHQGEI